MSPPLSVLTPLRVEAAAVRRGAPGAAVVVTGMGPGRSARAVAAWARPGPVAVMGFGGALQAGIDPGDLVVATEVRGPDGAVPLPSAGLVAATLRRAGLTVHAGPIVSADHLVKGDERSRLATTGALAVEMESAWLIQGMEGRPVAVVRSVVDTPEAGLASPATLAAGIRAYRSLSRAAAVLHTWAEATVPEGGTRNVVLAGPRSFCAGVERAIEIVERALDLYGPPVYVRKQIVHNRHVVGDLERRGAIFVDELDEAPSGARMVFSAHGVAPAVRAEAALRGLEVIDATCPLVAKVHAEARRFADRGDLVVLIGHAGHEEVEGTMGEAPEQIVLVQSTEDVDALELEDP
ncbi:MAG: 4-hydroxy-3-methylbut-2-enyl diphosphate reductase, partial [Acidimicrobiales bacterium]